MHIYAKLIVFIGALGIESALGASSTLSLTIQVQRKYEDSCASYQACSRRGELQVARYPTGPFGAITPTGKKCIQLLLDDKLLRQAKMLNGKRGHVVGVALPRLPTDANSITIYTEYFDRHLAEGACGDTPYVIYVTSIERTK